VGRQLDFEAGAQPPGGGGVPQGGDGEAVEPGGGAEVGDDLLWLPGRQPAAACEWRLVADGPDLRRLRARPRDDAGAFTGGRAVDVEPAAASLNRSPLPGQSVFRRQVGAAGPRPGSGRGVRAGDWLALPSERPSSPGHQKAAEHP